MWRYAVSQAGGQYDLPTLRSTRYALSSGAKATGGRACIGLPRLLRHCSITIGSKCSVLLALCCLRIENLASSAVGRCTLIMLSPCAEKPPANYTVVMCALILRLPHIQLFLFCFAICLLVSVFVMCLFVFLCYFHVSFFMHHICFVRGRVHRVN